MDDQFLKTLEETRSWLDRMDVDDYTINDDLTVDVIGDVEIAYRDLELIPVQFGVVDGLFNCAENRLVSLRGLPRKCLEVYCRGNMLTNLDWAPAECTLIHCRNNPTLRDINGAPDGCELIYDHDAVAKNQAARQLAELYVNDTESTPTTKPGRFL